MKQMKTAIWVCIVLITTGCVAVSVPVNRSIQSIQKIYNVPGLSQKQIYDKSLEWMAKTFMSSKAVIELKDPDNGKIIGNGVTTFTQSISGPMNCEYTITIDIKKEKIRVTFENFNGFYLEGRYPLSNNMGQFDQIEPKLIRLSESLVSYLKDSKTNEW